MGSNQIKIIDGQLFLNGTQLNGIQKYDIQSDGVMTFLKFEMVVESLLDSLDHREVFVGKNNEIKDESIRSAVTPKNLRAKLNQLKIVDGRLFLDDAEVNFIKKINLQKGIDGCKTYLKIKIIIC